MELKQVKDLMIPLDKYPHIPYWFTLRQAMVELEKSELDVNGKKSLPRILLIFDEKYQLLGLTRRRDIMRGLEPQFLAHKPVEAKKQLYDIKIDPNLVEMSYDTLMESIKERAERPVSDVMLPIAATLDYNDHLIKAIYEMVDNNISLIPVIKDDKIVGVLRSVEVFHEIATFVIS